MCVCARACVYASVRFCVCYCVCVCVCLCECVVEQGEDMLVVTTCTSHECLRNALAGGGRGRRPPRRAADADITVEDRTLLFKSLDKATEGACRPLQARIEQVKPPFCLRLRLRFESLGSRGHIKVPDLPSLKCSSHRSLGLFPASARQHFVLFFLFMQFLMFLTCRAQIVIWRVWFATNKFIPLTWK
jgi:hypothetical protein